MHISFTLCCVLFCLQGNFTHILQGYFTGTGAIIWLPQWQWSDPEENVHTDTIGDQIHELIDWMIDHLM